MENNERLLNLATKVKALRQQRNLTQEQVLDQTGVHVGRIEQGKRDVSYTTLCKLADFFGVGLDSFS